MNCSPALLYIGAPNFLIDVAKVKRSKYQNYDNQILIKLETIVNGVRRLSFCVLIIILNT